MRQCKGTRRDGSRCTAPPMKGQLVCRMHGGSSPQARAKAAVRQREQAIDDTLGKLGYAPVEDPLSALADLAGEVLAWKQQAAEHVARLKAMSRDNFATGGEEVRADILVFERGMDRAITVLATIARLNIDERLARISDEQAKAWSEFLRGVMTDPALSLSTGQRAEVKGAIERHLAAVS